MSENRINSDNRIDRGIENTRYSNPIGSDQLPASTANDISSAVNQVCPPIIRQMGDQIDKLPKITLQDKVLSIETSKQPTSTTNALSRAVDHAHPQPNFKQMEDQSGTPSKISPQEKALSIESDQQLASTTNDFSSIIDHVSTQIFLLLAEDLKKLI